MSAFAPALALIVGAATDAAVEGAINAGCRNADKLPALAEALARGWMLGIRALTTPTAAEAQAPPEAPAVTDALADAVRNGQVPPP